MKSFIYFVIFLFSIDTSFAFQPTDTTTGTDTFTISNTNTSTNTDTSTNTNTSSTDQTISIPCVDKEGAVKNAREADVCKSILPKCTEIKKKLIDSARDMLEWKIYGYYHLGKDLKLDSSSLKDPAGETMPYPLCSVVGQKLKAPSAITPPKDLEIDDQKIGQLAGCGDDPRFQNHKRDYRTSISYEGAYGKKWFAYVLGALPWEIRANAYDVFTGLKDDLSNLDQIIHKSELSKGAKKAIQDMAKNVADLSSTVKASCDSKDDNIVQNCLSGSYSVSDPVQRLCTLAKAQIGINETAMPNILVYEIMNRTNKMHKDLFGNIFNAQENPNFKRLLYHCARDVVPAPGGNFMSMVAEWLAMRYTYSCSVSCLVGKKEIYTWDDWHSSYHPSGMSRRQCTIDSRYDIKSANTTVKASMVNPYTRYYRNHKDRPTFTSGFAAMIESMIRLDICKQKNGKNTDNKCDQANITDMPLAKRNN